MASAYPKSPEKINQTEESSKELYKVIQLKNDFAEAYELLISQSLREKDWKSVFSLIDRLSDGIDDDAAGFDEAFLDEGG